MQPQVSAASQLDHDFPQYRGNALLVLKFHVALHVALQILTFKFGPKIPPPPHANTKVPPNAAPSS
jgi:hypothetical protein